MTRQEANLKLINEFVSLIYNNPDMRFGQILQNYMFVKCCRPAKPENMIDWQNEFYLESEELLDRVIKQIGNLNE